MQSRTSIALTIAASLAAVAAALVSQYVFDMQPCAWCVLQRLLFLVIAAVSAAGLWLRSPRARLAVNATVLLVSISGVASALWQHFVAARSISCRLSLAEQIVSGYLHLDQLMPSVFGIRVGCMEAATTLLGLPYELWSFAVFVLLGLVALLSFRRRWPIALGDRAARRAARG
jgi:disulfide bond formation protein DsbB